MTTATATAHANIALVKYWGKRDAERMLPATSSLSLTLDAFHTTTRVELTGAADGSDISVALDHRGQGIATAAMADVIAQADGRRVWSTIWSGNTAAVALCTRAGLQVETSEGGYLTVAR